jgi:hypothetical protein
MPISVVWSSSNGGSSITEPLSYGNISNGNISSNQTIYLRHNGVNPITSAAFFVEAVDSGVYGGDFTSSADKAELLAWGDAVITNDFGGVQFNQNAVGGFISGSWPTMANKNTVDGYGKVVRTGVGDSSTNPITVLSSTGATSNGTIQAGASPNVRFQARVVVPTNEGTLGVRQFNFALTFTSTT